MAGPISAKRNTLSTHPEAIADFGMAKNSASAGSWAMVVPPAFLIAAIPAVPSEPDPLKTTPISLFPKSRAIDSNNESMEGR
ncbi:MAG: hypothetical protein JWO20_1713 [Candidatus Angelobacter sp.]|nr:hypothetical protein [Candidatus Angelobacter sp.]